MSGDKPLVSVLIPAYNHEKYVQETIQSVINQTYQNIELLVVDDGSKDNTWNKIQDMKEACEKRFARAIFETKANGGVCSSLNRLISLAKGEYVFFLASDDVLKSRCIEKEVLFLSENPDYVLCTCDDEIIDSDSKRCFWDEDRNCVYIEKNAVYKTFGDWLKKHRRDVNFNSEDFGTYNSLCYDNYIPNGNLVRRAIFNKIGNFTPEAPLEDLWLMFQLSKYGKFKYFDEVLFSYRWHDSNSIKNLPKMYAITDKTKLYEYNILEEISKNNKFDEYLPIVKKVYEKGAERIARNYFNIIKVKTYIRLNSKIKKVNIEVFGIKIYSYNKSILN